MALLSNIWRHMFLNEFKPILFRVTCFLLVARPLVFTIVQGWGAEHNDAIQKGMLSSVDARGLRFVWKLY